MKAPRDLGGAELARLLGRFGYRVVRQTGSHIRLTSSRRRPEHHITIPAHRPLKIGTLSRILRDAAVYLEMSREELSESLFGS